MPHSYYKNGKINQRTILKLIRTGIYRVDIETGAVTGKKGKELKQEISDEENGGSGYLFVYLYHEKKYIKIAVHKLVWMAATMSCIPAKFQIHHINKDIHCNGFANLMCVHRLDHDKIHKIYENKTNDRIPF